MRTRRGVKKVRVDERARFVVIMAGGRGERFWPVSREARPKQLLRLLGASSLLQQAVDRVRPLVPEENIFVITNLAQLPEVRRQLPGLPRANVVAEPMGRDTAAAVTLGAALVGSRSEEGVMAVLPADHVISREKRFQQVLADCFDMAGGVGAMVTIGIKPTEPSTGYGYIEVGEELRAEGVGYRTPFHRVERFVEKPSLDRAIDFVNSGSHRWNAGMFIWSFVTVTEGLRKHQPALHRACRRWVPVAGHPIRLGKVLAEDYPKIERISIDYALMEKAENVVVADGDFAWDDLGSWTALARHLKSDGGGNCAVGELVQVDSERNIIFDARRKHRTPIALVGMHDAILVQTDDAVLVVDRGQAQKVKELVKKLARDSKWSGLV